MMWDGVSSMSLSHCQAGNSSSIPDQIVDVDCSVAELGMELF